MGMMDKMMKGMIKAMPVEEREALMLKMMPDMMEQADMVKLMPNMLKEFSGLISLLSIYEFFRILLKDNEAKDQIKGILSNLKEKMPSMMEMMHPMMLSMMSPTLSSYPATRMKYSVSIVASRTSAACNPTPLSSSQAISFKAAQLS